MGRYEAKGRALLSPRNRAYAYRVMTGAGLVAIFYGILSEAELGVWLTLAGLALGTTSEVAHANVPKAENE